MRPVCISLVLTSLLTLIACSHDDDHSHDTPSGGHSSPYPTCDTIIKACHELDFEEGPIHDCHDVGHSAKSDADCIPKKDECLRICVAKDGGTADASDQ